MLSSQQKIVTSADGRQQRGVKLLYSGGGGYQPGLSK